MSKNNTFQYKIIKSPLGDLIIIADHLVRVVAWAKFNDLQCDVSYWSDRLGADLVLGNSDILQKLQQELEQYFVGSLQEFTVPYDIEYLTQFQQRALQQVSMIQYGTTKSYKQVASDIGNFKASRAVGTANACNRLALIIPCHRVIASNGFLGGYAYGVDRKRWLLQHEIGMLVQK